MVNRSRNNHQDSTVSPKTNRGDAAETVDRIVRHAGYKRPTALQSAVVPLFDQGKDLLIEARSGEGKTGAMLIPLLISLDGRTEAGTKALILTDSAEQVAKIQRQYKRFASRLSHRPTLVAVGKEAGPHRELRSLRKRGDILVGTTERVIDHLRRNNLTLEGVDYSVLDVPRDINKSGYDKDVLFIYSKMSGKQQTVAFLDDLKGSSAFDSILRRPQHVAAADRRTVESADEEKNMSDNERIKETIDEIISRLKGVESPDILNHYRRVFRKHVPFNLRGYVSAYLLKEHLGKQGVVSDGGDGGTKTLFVSIGKNRKVYPRDLSRLFADALGIDQSQIGGVKILESYSFIDVPEAYAEKAIEALNDTDFRGRKIAVNHARRKRK